MAKDRKHRASEKPAAASGLAEFARAKIWGPQPKADESKLDHQDSKLPPAKFAFKLDQDKVIANAVKGHFGSTEVPPKQVW